MASYDELKAQEADAATRFANYEGDCFALANELIDELRARLKWPADSLKLAKDPAEQAENRMRAAMRGGWVDWEGRVVFRVAIRLDRTSTEVPFKIHRADGNWFAAFHDREPVAIDRGDKASVAPLADVVVSIVRENIDRWYPPQRI